MSEETNNRITVLNPIQKKWSGLFTNEQMVLFGVGALTTLELSDVANQFDYPYNIAAYAAINIPLWAVIGYYNRSHDFLMESINRAEFRVKQLLGRDAYNKYTDTEAKIQKLLDIDHVRPDGIICFQKPRGKTKGKYGVIIPCISSTTHDDERVRRTNLIQRLHDSFSPDTTVQFSVKSQILPLNTVEQMILKQCPTRKTKQEMELVNSMLEKSKNSKRPVDWFMTIGLFIECDNEGEVQSFAGSTIPGVLHALQNAGILAYILTNRTDITMFYANEFSSLHIPQTDRLPLLLDKDSFFAKIVNQILPGKIKFYNRHFIIDSREWGTCITCLLPKGGVSGVPPDISFAFIDQIYSTAASEAHTVRIDLKYMPSGKSEALDVITAYKNAIDVDMSTAKKNGQLAELEKYEHERLRWKKMGDKIMDGDLGMFYGVFIITILADNKDTLKAGVGKIRKILDSRRIHNEIVSGKMDVVYSWTKMTPMQHVRFMKKISPKMFTDCVTQLTPLLSAAHPTCSAEGIHYIVTEEGKEIIIDERKLPNQHKIIVGGSGSGKTTFELALGLRKFSDGDVVTYISDKSDNKTSFLNVAKYLGTNGQVIELGSKSNPNEPVYNINILDIIHPDVEFNPEIVFHQHISMIKNWFSVLFKNSVAMSDNMPAYIEKSLMQLYHSFGINPRNPTTWHPSPTPKLVDLVKIWEAEAEGNESAQALMNKSSVFLYTGKFLSEDTNVDLNKRFVVIDLSGVARVDAALADAMKYFMTVLLTNKMFTRSERHKVLLVDEGRGLLKNKFLSDHLMKLLTQLRSFDGELVISTLETSDFADVDQEILSNTSEVIVLGNNIRKTLDIVVKTFKLSPTSEKYLYNCTEPGQGVVMVGAPFHQEYCGHLRLSNKEKEVILGQDQSPHIGHRFHTVGLEAFAREQRVILSTQIEGDTTSLEDRMIVVPVQNVFGRGRIRAYIDPDPAFLQDGKIWNQTLEHYCSVLQIASFFIKQGFETFVSHNNGPDVLTKLSDGFLPVEYQTTPANIQEKRIKLETKYGRLVFVGDDDSTSAMRAVFGDSKEGKEIARQIVVSRGTALEKRLQEIIDESQKGPIHFTPNLSGPN